MLFWDSNYVLYFLNLIQFTHPRDILMQWEQLTYDIGLLEFDISQVPRRGDHWWISDTSCNQNHISVCWKVGNNMAYFWLLPNVWWVTVSANASLVNLYNGSNRGNWLIGHFFDIRETLQKLVDFCMYSLIMVNNVNVVMWDGKKILKGEYLGKAYVCGRMYANKWVKFKVVRLYK